MDINIKASDDICGMSITYFFDTGNGIAMANKLIDRDMIESGTESGIVIPCFTYKFEENLDEYI